MYWVVRESVRKALNKRKLKFASREELVESARTISKAKYKFDNLEVLNQSKLLKNIRTQKNLREFF